MTDTADMLKKSDIPLLRAGLALLLITLGRHLFGRSNLSNGYVHPEWGSLWREPSTRYV
jgi:hypothetical protein